MSDYSDVVKYCDGGSSQASFSSALTASALNQSCSGHGSFNDTKRKVVREYAFDSLGPDDSVSNVGSEPVNGTQPSLKTSNKSESIPPVTPYAANGPNASGVVQFQPWNPATKPLQPDIPPGMVMVQMQNPCHPNGYTAYPNSTWTPPHTAISSGNQPPVPQINQLCQMWTRGLQCPFLPNCPYRHSLSDLEVVVLNAQASTVQNAPVPPLPAPVFQITPQPSPICAFFRSGTCRNGDACTFRHEPGAPAESPLSNSLAKPCNFFKKGNCKNGSNCPFLHEEDSGYPNTNGHSPPTYRSSDSNGSWKQEKGTQPCSYFLKGNCRKGDNCTYLHENTNVAPFDDKTADDHPTPTAEQAFQWQQDQASWGDANWGESASHHGESSQTEEHADITNSHQNDHNTDPNAYSNDNQQKMYDEAEKSWGATGGDWGLPPEKKSNGGWDAGSYDNRPAYGKQSKDNTWQNERRGRSCYQFIKQGYCSFGDSCRFEHDVRGGAVGKGWTGTDTRTESRRSDASSTRRSHWSGTDNSRQTNGWGLSHHRNETEVNPINSWAQTAEDDGKQGLDEVEDSRAASDQWGEHQATTEEPFHNDDQPESSSDSGPDPWEELDYVPKPSKKQAKGDLHQDRDGTKTPVQARGINWAEDVEKQGTECWNHEDGPSPPEAAESYDDNCVVPEPAIPGEDFRPEGPILKEELFFGAMIQFGQHAAPEMISTAFDSDSIVLSNIPVSISDEQLTMLARPFGDVVRIISDHFVAGTPKVEVVFATFDQARAAVEALCGSLFEGATIGANLNSVAPVRFLHAQIKDPFPTFYVRIAWNIPSATAWAYYNDLTTAKQNEKRLNGTIFQGKKLSVTYQRNPKQHNQYPLTVEGLRVDVTEADILWLTGASHVIFCGGTIDRKFSTNPSEDLQRLLSPICPIDHVDIVQADHSKTKACAFISVDSLADVSKLAAEKLSLEGRHSLRFERKFSIRYTIEQQLHHLVTEEISRLHKDQPEATQIRQYGSHPAFIRLWSNSAENLHLASLKVESIVEGHILTRDEKPLWHDFFDSQTGRKLFEKINRGGIKGVYVFPDYRVCIVRLFGGADVRAEARKQILTQLDIVERLVKAIPLTIPLFGFLLNNGLKSLCGGQHKVTESRLSLDLKSRQLIVYGKPDHVAQVEETLESLDVASDTLKDGCPLCGSAPKHQRVHLECGHVYCKSCFISFLEFMVKTNRVTLCCTAKKEDDSPCAENIPYGLLQRLITPDTLNSLLEQSLLHYLRAHTDQYQFCPTFHCRTVYCRSKEGTAIKCPECSTWICASCCVRFHDGLTCQQYKSLRETRA